VYDNVFKAVVRNPNAKRLPLKNLAWGLPTAA
jgi:hypothetical protein